MGGHKTGFENTVTSLVNVAGRVACLASLVTRSATVHRAVRVFFSGSSGKCVLLLPRVRVRSGTKPRKTGGCHVG